jgi:RNA polymerase sigma-70 factor (ECF subfamily)
MVMDPHRTDGNGHELGEVLEGMRPRLEKLVAVRMDPRLRRRIDPEDVIQAAFVDVVRRFEEWAAMHSNMPLFLWVRLLTVQKLAEFHRRHLGALKRDVRREVDGPDPGTQSATLMRAIVDQHESPSKVVVRLEQKDALHYALDHMKTMDREILMLRHFERLTNEECAHVLGLTRSGAKIRHLRAARRLRGVLKHADLPEDLIHRRNGDS